MSAYKIDEQLRSLLAPLDDDELQQLHENIDRDGEITDPVIIWKGHGIVVDGMNRFEYHLVTGVPCKFKEMEFKGRDEVIQWIISRQLGRRNTAGLAKAQMRRLLVECVARKHKAEKKTPNIKVSNRQAVEEVAEKLDVHPRTIYRDLEVANIVESLPVDIRKKIENGVIGSSAESLRQLDELPPVQRQAVLDMVSVVEPLRDEQPFRHLDEVIEAVVEHHEGKPEKEDPAKRLKKLEDLLVKLGRFLDDLPVKIDEVAALKNLARDPWKERAQAALKNFRSVWYEKCKPNS